MAMDMIKEMENQEYAILEAILELGGTSERISTEAIMEKTGLSFETITRITGPMLPKGGKGFVNGFGNFEYTITDRGIQHLKNRR